MAADDEMVNDHCKFKALRDDLNVLHQQMKVLDVIGAKLNSLFNKIGDEMPQFLNCLNTLYSTEIKSGIFMDRESDSDSPLLPKYTLFFVEFQKYQRKLMSIFKVVFYDRSQHDDLKAFTEIFSVYDRNQKWHDRLCRAVTKWEEMEQSQRAKQMELKPGQRRQKEADCNSKNDVFELLDMTRQIVMTQSIEQLATLKARCWRERINAFYSAQFALNRMTKKSHIEHGGKSSHSMDEWKDGMDSMDRDGIDGDGGIHGNGRLLKRMQFVKDENATLQLQNKELRKQIKILTKDADHLRKDNIQKGLNINVIRKEQRQQQQRLQRHGADSAADHQYDAFPSLSEIVEDFGSLKEAYCSKPPQCIMKDVRRKYGNHSEQFVGKVVHEMLFDILFMAFGRMREFEAEWLLNAAKLYHIEDTAVLRDLLRASLHRTHLHIYNEVKEEFAGNILSAVLSSYRYALSMYVVSVDVLFE